MSASTTVLEPAGITAPSRVRSINHPPLVQMHPGVIGLAAGGYAAMILVFWLGFATNADKFLPLFIFTVVLAAFTGVPWWMAQTGRSFWRRHGVRNEPRFGSFGNFLHSTFDSGGGRLSGSEAVVLVALLPIALTAGLIAMAVIMHAIR